MMGLTQRQHDLAVLLVTRHRERSEPLSLASIARLMGMRSTSKGGIHRLLIKLRERGYVICSGRGAWHPTASAHRLVPPDGMTLAAEIKAGASRAVVYVIEGLKT